VNNSSALLQIIQAGIDSVRPAILFPRVFANAPAELAAWQETPARFLLAIGKAAVSSTVAVLNECSATDYFAIAPPLDSIPEKLDRAKIHFGSHPVPDHRSQDAALALLSWLKALPDDGRLLVLLSGGASALMVSPLQGITLEVKMKVNEFLLKSGASIHEMNVVRKHFSAVKGGRLAQIAARLSPVVLALSDVIGDDLATIGSGPFYPDPSTFLQTRSILEKYELWMRVDSSARELIEKGIAGEIAETPKSFDRAVAHYVVGSNRIARMAAAEKANALGYEAREEKSEVQGMVEVVAEQLMQRFTELPAHTAYISGGEVTVRLKGNGKGGRNQHLALLLTAPIAGSSIAFAAAGTDGVDGNSTAAGAWTDGETRSHAEAAGVNIENSIAEFNSFPFFKALQQSIETGPTGTNVMDLYIALK
jgi:glycerate 2-kinase